MDRKGLFQTIAACRHFFQNEGYLETPTPPLVPNPGMEAHLHPFQVKSLISKKELPLYLHTSPEFSMKELLSEGFEKIYHLGYCFRDEPASSTHRHQFLMLEWYQAETYYQTIKKETIELVKFTHDHLLKNNISVIDELNFEQVTVDELFREYLGWSILDYLDEVDLKQKIISDHPELISDNSIDMPWEDYFFLIFLNKIEIHFKNYSCLIVDEFPAPLAALSTLKESDPRVCERFEFYLKGVELCNCFNELTDLEEQRKRMELEGQKKHSLYGYTLPKPKILYQALKKGLPKSSGNALGVERLYLGLSNSKETGVPFYS